MKSPLPSRILVAPALLLGACTGVQSALDPAGRDAERIATLFWAMVIGAGVVWLIVMGSAVYAARAKRQHTERMANRFIVLGGIVFPTVVLTGLLIGGLRLLPPILDLGPDEPAVEVTGEQFWWRARYRFGEGTVEVANELHLPVGVRTAMTLESPDVIHSFWVPSLGGKIDTMPGRTNHMALEPTREGVYRGACAEYCGQAHALMVLHVVTEPPADFDAWLAHQAEPARPAAGTEAGARLFLEHGCGACHTVRGTEATGVLGPDLTHVGSRRHLGGVLPNDPESFVRFVRDAKAIKPEARMPAFDALSEPELEALAHYLDGLR